MSAIREVAELLGVPECLLNENRDPSAKELEELIRDITLLVRTMREMYFGVKPKPAIVYPEMIIFDYPLSHLVFPWRVEITDYISTALDVHRAVRKLHLVEILAMYFEAYRAKFDAFPYHFRRVRHEDSLPFFEDALKQLDLLCRTEWDL